MTTRPAWIADLTALGACREGVAWARAYPSLAEAWADCSRADWMLWLAGRLAPPDSDASRQLVLCACACARTTLHLIPADEPKPRRAIEIAEQWAQQQPGVTLADVQTAAAAATDAATDAAYAAASDDAAPAHLRTLADLVRQHYPTPPELTS